MRWLVILAFLPTTCLLEVVKIESLHIKANGHEITKHFTRDKFETTGMSSHNTFMSELNIYKQLINCNTKCAVQKLIARLTNYSVSHQTLTFRKQELKMLCEAGASYDLYALLRWLQLLSDALSCCGVVHCDLQPKNIGVSTNNMFYAFDFDMAYASSKAKPKGMECPFDSRRVNTSDYMSAFTKTLRRPCVISHPL